MASDPSDPSDRRDETQPLLSRPADIDDDDAGKKSRAGFVALLSILLLLCTIGYHSLQRNSSGNVRQPEYQYGPIPSLIRSDKEKLLGSLHMKYQCKSQHTVKSLPSFSSYLDNSNPSNPKPINVSYDSRSIRINYEATILLSGSNHPVRATQYTWSKVLDQAVQGNLNMVTIYLMWGYHQPNPYENIDWTLPGIGDGDTWNVANAIWEAACRGLYVHIRIGPYVCAEYTYGGIPEWVPLVFGGDTDDTKMSMRRPNKQWLDAMKVWVDASLAYLTDNGLFAYQGGPIILAQIENELGGDVDPKTENLIPNKTLQDYANWCGDVAHQAQPSVIWTMCNGLSSDNTINTCNGYGEGGSCSTNWGHGQSGRIQVDQPALWTESEMGFQIWGDAPTNTSDYFWGRTARDVAGDVLRWFARGGCHINHYMFFGGYNRGRTAAAGIMNAYATDALICSNGQKRQPKFDHLANLHRTIAMIAGVLVNSPTALGKDVRLKYRSTKDGSEWKKGTKQLAFRYEDTEHYMSVIFAENDSPDEVDVRIPLEEITGPMVIRMKGWSSVVVVDGKVIFNSADVNSKAMSYRRNTVESIPLNDWVSWLEPRGARSDHAISDSRPWEQTRLLLASNSSTDYIWYETTFTYDDHLKGDISLIIETQIATAITVFLDDEYIGSAENHEHTDDNCTLNIPFPDSTMHDATVRLRLLSESLGYGNLIGRWGTSSAAKTKGITGDVWLEGKDKNGKDSRLCLTCGQQWKSQAGLQGRNIDVLLEAKRLKQNNEMQKSDALAESPSSGLSIPCTWTSAKFSTPSFDSDQELMLKINTGRGSLWLNGVSLGHFWNITRRPPTPKKLSQEYYHLPRDFLKQHDDPNHLLFFNIVGGGVKTSSLVLTSIEPSGDPSFRDEVDFDSACL